MSEAKSSSRRLLLAAPLIVFGVLAGIMGKQIFDQSQGKDTSELPSALLGKSVPVFDLPPLPGLKTNDQEVPGLATGDLKGGVRVVNIFASWCAPCRAEHPVLVELSKDKRFDVVGINYKDDPENALRFLGALGNPYTNVGVDRRGRTAIEWGFYGIPETLLVDAAGIIRHKIVGPISAKKFQDLKKKINVLLEEQRG